MAFLDFSTGRRAVLLAMIVVAGAELRAAFELKAELPATFADGAVTVSRESWEERESVPVQKVQLVGGRFRAKVESEPGLYNLSVGDAQVSFVAGEGQTLEVAAGGEGKLRVSGGSDQALYEAYEEFRTESLGRLVLPARAAGAAATTEAEIARLTEAEVEGYSAHRRELNDFTLKRLGGSPALYAASLRWDGDHRLGELGELVADYSAQHPKLEISRLMDGRLARFRAVAIGAVAPAISGPGPEGATVALADLRGRYVLVDFWASWCGPCRIENRHYVELYRQYRAAGFEILAVSVDETGPAWKAGIAKDGAVWKHVSDLLAWKSPLAARYNVTALPASFLLDPEGKIIAKDVRGKKLDSLLAERLGKAPR